jgi:hypothetical protein
MPVVYVRCDGGDADKIVKFLFILLVNVFDLSSIVFIDCSTFFLRNCFNSIDFYAFFFQRFFKENQKYKLDFGEKILALKKTRIYLRTLLLLLLLLLFFNNCCKFKSCINK